MSGRLDILWVPQEANSFVTLGSELRLFRIRKLVPNEPIKTGHQRLGPDHTSVAEVLAVHSDLQYAKCASAFHGKVGFPLLALGCANGRVLLSSFKQTGVECPLVGLELMPRHARPCNCVAWNPNEGGNHLLAAGLDKHRTEAGLFIWDLSSAATTKQASEPSLRPTREYSVGEGIFSLSWFPKSTQKIATGAQRSVRIYDMRQASNESAMASQTKAVYGICIDAFNEQRLAAFNENVISIWDTRSFEKPLASITEPKNILRIGWNPTRSGLLACVTKETSQISLHDVQTSIVTDEPDLVVLTRNVKCSKESPSAFAWHPKDGNRLLTLSTTGALSDSVVFERMPVLLSSEFGIAWTTGKDVKYGRTNTWTSDSVPSVDVATMKEDISFKIYDRVLRGYGLNPDSKLGIAARNALLVVEDEKLWEMWQRLKEWTTASIDAKALVPVSRNDKVRGSQPYQRGINTSSNHKEVATPPPPPSSLCGVKAALLQTTAAGDGATEGGQMCPKSSIDLLSCKGLDVRSRWKVFRNKGRSRALRLCGWEPDRDSKAFDAFIQRLIVEAEFERAAAIAVFNLHLKLAVEILQIADYAYSTYSESGREDILIDFAQFAPSLRQLTLTKDSVHIKGKPDHGDTLKFCTMALSGFTQEKTTLWRELCAGISAKLSDAYLRAIFSFLTADDDDDRDSIVKETNGMKLADRVALACIFVPDARLYDFIEKLTGSLIEDGDLDGLLLTGVSDEGLTLLQHFVDKSGDVQSAALAICIAAAAGSTAVSSDERFIGWCQAYRLLLDQWTLWHHRSEFDVQRNLLEQSENHVKEQVLLICNFCSKPVTSTPTTNPKNARSGGGGGGGQSATAVSPANSNAPKPCITSCSNCRKPLPRCALCQVNIGTAIPSSPPTFDVSIATPDSSQLRSWFTWCQSCRHGGHADHIAEWFSTHRECPVTQCECFCGSLDALARGVPAS